MMASRSTTSRHVIVFTALSLVVATGCVTVADDEAVPGASTMPSVPVLGGLDPNGTDSGGQQAPSTGGNNDGATSGGQGSDGVDSSSGGASDSSASSGGSTGPDSASSSTPSSTSTALLALTVLEAIEVENEYSTGYSRELFRHWTDADSDGCNTREEVLIAESRSLAQVDRFGCTVVAGDWFSPFDGVFHTDPSDLDIDHMVPLKEAWDSGAHAWTASQRERFANDLSDPRALVAVTSGVNRSKGDRDPSQWLPPRGAHVCTYISDWISVKHQWGLSMDQSEHGRLRNLLTGQCARTTIAAWGRGSDQASASGSSITSSTSPSSSSTTSSTNPPKSVATTTPEGSDSGDLPTVTPGAYCSPIGAYGLYKGTTYVCSTTNADGVPYSNGRARWRRA